jgi:hypothetical protein
MLTRRPRFPARRVGSGPAPPRQCAYRGMCVAAIAFTTVSVSTAPLAVAGTGDSLRAAVAAARGTSCGALRYDPIVEQSAQKVNETTDKWINHASRAVPETNALPLLKDLGYRGTKAAILSGASKTDGDAIKGLILQGHLTIPDCSYTDFGVGAMRNETKGMILTTVVLAG